MGRIENFKQYAADCMRQAEGEESIQDKDILLNVALAWVRLAQQAAGEPILATGESFEDAGSVDSDLLETDPEDRPPTVQ